MPPRSPRSWSRRAVLGAAASLVAGPAVAIAQSAAYPSRPITLIVPWPAGGQTDITMRILAELAGRSLGQPVVVENRPGAAGTLEELFEAWTWGMLGLHAKPTALVDVDGFWQPLVGQLRRMVDDGYLDAARLDALGVVHDAAELLRFVESYEHPARKWSAPSSS